VVEGKIGPIRSLLIKKMSHFSPTGGALRRLILIQRRAAFNSSRLTASITSSNIDMHATLVVCV